MPELVEQMYCSQQIVIPPKFPYLLKRYCKAAIKTQPYDLLRWSFEYFKALSEHRPPPVKLRLEYPVYSTEGGLTRGCLKVLANQLAGQTILPLTVVKAAWQGFCLDPEELRRIFCLCQVHMRNENVPFLHFIAVAGGMLTKSLTHTMILLCETLTKEPDGGSAAICIQEFLSMYRFLAVLDASTDVRYIDGYREGFQPPKEEESVEEEEEKEVVLDTESEDDFWQASSDNLHRLSLIDDHVAKTANLSSKVHHPIIGKLERSPSAERAIEIEREKFMRDWTEKPRQDEEINKQLRQLSDSKVEVKEEAPKEETVQEEEKIEINVFDEHNNRLPLEFYGEPVVKEDVEEEEEYVVQVKSEVKSQVKSSKSMARSTMDAAIEEENVVEEELTEKQKIQQYVEESYMQRDERRDDFLQTLEDICEYVDHFETANYDLGMVAGRQMSITSGEFIVHNIEKEIMDYIDEQIGVLPDPDLKKKKAKPAEVQMIRDYLYDWLEENMEIIAPELEEAEEEEEPLPDIVMVCAVPGIGPSVDDDTMHCFTEYAQETAKVQNYVFMPRNIRHFMCPPLEKYIETVYEEDKDKANKEELPTGGRFTD